MSRAKHHKDSNTKDTEMSPLTPQGGWVSILSKGKYVGLFDTYVSVNRIC